MATFQLNDFMHCKKDGGALLQEISSLQCGTPPQIISVVSHHTNRELQFRQVKVEMWEEECTIGAWHYRPVSRDNVNIKELIIFND